MTIKRSQLPEKFGKITGQEWPDERLWMAAYQVPNFINMGKKNIYMNRAMFLNMDAALNNLRVFNIAHELDEFNGCFNIRSVRGVPGLMSVHSWGLAIDVNGSRNPLGAQSTLSRLFVKCFKDAGFFWGGDYRRPDPMHFTIVDEAR
jgi:hypothetical protein